tara:strand:+ start:466 stop:765 length:300 start_codon:yes stop_codon:yes gene_type:complete
MAKKKISEEEKISRKKKYDRARYLKARAEKTPIITPERYKNRPKTYNTRSAKEECGTRIVYVNELHIDGNVTQNNQEKPNVYPAVNFENIMNKLDGIKN